MKKKWSTKILESLMEMDSKTIWSATGLFLIIFWGCVIWIMKSFL